jgi:hypothetical protein
MKHIWGIAGLFGLLLTRQADADYVFGYTAAECERIGSGTKELTESGWLVNLTGANIDVICPIKVNGSGFLEIVDARMAVQDKHTSENFSCTLTCRDDDSIYDSDPQASSGTSDYYELDFSGVDYYAYGACFITCSVPKVYNGTNLSAVRSYVVSIN